MASQAVPLTLEQERDQLFAEGSTLRGRIVEELRKGQEIRVTPRETVTRTQITNAEGIAHRLTEDFMVFDGRISDYVQRLATQQNVPNLNRRLELAIYVSQLSAHRETSRSALRDLSEVVSSRRAQANAMLALIVSLASVFIALFLGIVNVMSR